jgi:LacI family transcriptional regulator
MNDYARLMRGSARPTMKDVAARAGVALKTVSRVVNGEPGVTPETAKRVLGAIEDLGFRRNESARLLRTGRTATLGFIADDCADPELAALCRGLAEVAGDHGYALQVGCTDGEPSAEERIALAMCARRIDGLAIVPAPGDQRYLVPEIEAGTAAVFVLRAPAWISADVVLADERGGAKAAIAHLIGHGHRRIGYIGDQADHRSRELLRGYAEAMAAAGLPADASWTTLTPRRLLDPPGPPVTAVLCGGREHTAGVLRTLAGASRAPRVAVIGFGDLDLADVVSPGLTVVSYDAAEAGRTAAELLVRRLAGEQGPPRRVVLPATLIQRGSAEFAPAPRR